MGGTVRIACVGGGPAGLYFSILMKLWDPANDVTVFERSKEGATHGWGVTMEQKFLATLAELDAESAKEIKSQSVRWHDQVVSFGGGREVNDCNGDAHGVGRQRFVDLLAHRARQLGVDIHYYREVRDKSELPDADLIVAADGVNSRFRTSPEFGTSITEGRNKYIWLGTGKVFESFSFFFEPTEAGWIWAHAYQHDPTTSTFIVECAPETWTGLGFDAGPVGRTLDRLESIFASPLAGRRLWTLFSDGTEAQWLNFRTVSNERWHDGNVVLVGDAAHTANFSVGLGTTLAMQDVIALASHLRRVGDRAACGAGIATADLHEALTAYQKQRQAELRARATEAARSALWFESVARYTNLTPSQFAAVLHARRAPLLSLLPPPLFCYLHALRRQVGVIDKLRSLADR
ncbi:MAG TPA: FAD-dependent monooxygenase [Trebonia sp.]|jgi:2-polyprenyl-6-methoxyphenol hydroxylase-like FAD-dependent oxidoreductase|nr:FAD-dependent monooxygenase [Trebonia sp.]